MASIKYLFLVAALVTVTGCGRSCRSERETPVRGTALLMVDETILPMIKGQAQMFEHTYPLATLNLADYPELEISSLLMNDSAAQMAVLTRPLNPTEEAWSRSVNITPRVTPLAFDGIALITNKQSIDTLISTQTLREILRGEQNGHTLVFDNPASGIVRFMKEYAEVDSLANSYAMRSNREVIDYIAENTGAIGFVGSNWLFEPDSTLRDNLQKVRMLAVGSDAEGYYLPTQNHIAEGWYPFTRRIYFINLQGSSGLGLGFASFIIGEVGQRIALISGVVPITYPTREIIVRTEL